MLFDLKGKRRRAVQGTYLTLAVLMGLTALSFREMQKRGKSSRPRWRWSVVPASVSESTLVPTSCR